jgi:hypothetical protein
VTKENCSTEPLLVSLDEVDLSQVLESHSSRAQLSGRWAQTKPTSPLDPLWRGPLEAFPKERRTCP